MTEAHHSATSSTLHSLIGFCEGSNEGAMSSDPLLRSDCDAIGIVSCFCKVATDSLRFDDELTGVSCGGVLAVLSSVVALLACCSA